VQTKGDYERVATLAAERLATQQELELARSNYDAANASVAGAIANVAQARAQIKQKDAAVAIARTNVDHTVIRSPIDGIVIARNVDVGQTVAASLQAPTIFTIAQDLTRMQLYAKADESDVSRIKVGLFGAPTRVPIGPAVLAAESGAEVFVIAMRRVGWARWSARVETIELEAGAPRKARVRDALDRELRLLERLVADAPEQWWSIFFPLWERP